MNILNFSKKFLFIVTETFIRPTTKLVLLRTEKHIEDGNKWKQKNSQYPAATTVAVKAVILPVFFPKSSVTKSADEIRKTRPRQRDIFQIKPVAKKSAAERQTQCIRICKPYGIGIFRF